MSHPKEKMIVLSFDKLDTGNTAANAQMLVAPCKLILERAVCTPLTPVANSFTISVSTTYNNASVANAAAVITIPDAAVLGVGYVDTGVKGLVILPGTILRLSNEEAGDSGEFCSVSLLCEYLPETVENSILIETV